MSINVISVIVSVIGISVVFLVPYLIIRKMNAYAKSKSWYKQAIATLSMILLLLSLCCTFWYYLKIDARPIGMPFTNDSGFTPVYFPDLAEKDKLKNNPDIVNTNSSTIPFHGSTLQISELLQTRINHVVVKKIPAKGPSIRVLSYVTKSWYKGIDITDRLYVPELTIADNALIYKDSSPSYRAFPSIEEIYFAIDPTVAQFVSDKKYEGTWGFPINGSNMIYLEVPSNIAVNDPAGIAYFIK